MHCCHLLPDRLKDPAEHSEICAQRPLSCIVSTLQAHCSSGFSFWMLVLVSGKFLYQETKSRRIFPDLVCACVCIQNLNPINCLVSPLLESSLYPESSCTYLGERKPLMSKERQLLNFLIQRRSQYIKSQWPKMERPWQHIYSHLKIWWNVTSSDHQWGGWVLFKHKLCQKLWCF